MGKRFSSNNKEVAEAAINKDFVLLDRLTIISLSYFLSVVLGKVVQLSSNGVLGVSVPFDYSIVIFLALTLWHFYLTKLLTGHLRLGFRTLDDDERRNFFENKMADGPFLIRGSFEYSTVSSKQNDLILASTRYDDPPSYIQLALVFAAIAASTPWHIGFLSWALLSCSIALIVVNWKLGSSWFIAWVDFSQKASKTKYFLDEFRPRTIHTISGPWVGPRTTWTKFMISSIKGSVVAGVIISSLVMLIVGLLMLIVRLLT